MFLNVLVRLTCALCGSVLLASCSGTVTPNAGEGGQSARHIELAYRGQVGDEPSRVYRLGVGDKLRVTVFGEPDLSGNFEVNVHGAVSMPLIGEVGAQNLSISQFRERVHGRLADGYLKEPRIAVSVLNYRPFYVQGEVRNAGEYEYKPGLTINDAVAMAGGYSYRARKSAVELRRQGEPKAVSVTDPLRVPVLPGDNITVPERFF